MLVKVSEEGLEIKGIQGGMWQLGLEMGGMKIEMYGWSQCQKTSFRICCSAVAPPSPPSLGFPLPSA